MPKVSLMQCFFLPTSHATFIQRDISIWFLTLATRANGRAALTGC
jgi:hypothetical protein